MKYDNRVGQAFASVMIIISIQCILLRYTAEASSALTVSLTLDTPTTMTLGEPIIGHYMIKNTSGHDLLCRVGPQTNGCLTVGDSVPGKRLSKDQCPQIYAEASDQLIRVPAKDNHGGVHTGYFVINGWHEPGLHTLSLTVHFTYSTAQDTVSPGYGTRSDNNPTINQIFQTEVTVLPTDVRQVRDMSETLRRSVLKERDFDQRQLYITALFSMPDILVHDCWQRLIEDGRMRDIDQDSVVQRLALIPSVQAADLLAEQQWSQPQVCSYQFIPRDALANMYNTGNPTLRQHIREIYALHGEQVADKIDIPQAMD